MVALYGFRVLERRTFTPVRPEKHCLAFLIYSRYNLTISVNQLVSKGPFLK
jgi:hypothetical protein